MADCAQRRNTPRIVARNPVTSATRCWARSSRPLPLWASCCAAYSFLSLVDHGRRLRSALDRHPVVFERLDAFGVERVVEGVRILRPRAGLVVLQQDILQVLPGEHVELVVSGALDDHEDADSGGRRARFPVTNCSPSLISTSMNWPAFSCQLALRIAFTWTSSIRPSGFTARMSKPGMLPVKVVAIHPRRPSSAQTRYSPI